MTSIDRLMASTQRGCILAHLISRIGKRSSKKEIRDALGIEQVSSRIGELRSEGWDIRGGRDGLGLGPDGTQEYMLASVLKQPPKIKIAGVTLTQDWGREVKVRIHGRLSEGMTQGFSDWDLRTLRAKLQAAYQAWYDETSHHLKGPALPDDLDAIDFEDFVEEDDIDNLIARM